ncbi:MAG: hypothetical protein M3340_07320 [Actinomycetota bacterium]|nr:hypothetical protein [Actinomycetota bacterium]
MIAQRQCDEVGCDAQQVGFEDKCWGHLADSEFDEACENLAGYGPSVDMTRTTIEGPRVRKVLHRLALATEGKEPAIERPVDLTGAKVSGDVALAGTTVNAGPAFATEAWDGALRLSAITGLNNIGLSQATIDTVAISDCHGERERLRIRGADISQLALTRCGMWHLGVVDSRLAATLDLEELEVAGLRVNRCAIGRVSLQGVRISGSANLDRLYTSLLSLHDCAFESWVDVGVAGRVIAVQSSFDGPIELNWRPLPWLERDLGRTSPSVPTVDFEGVEPPPEAATFLRLRSVRFGSNAAIRWCSGVVELHTALFAAPSTLDQVLGASGPPIVGTVANLDGEALRFASVDISQTELARATGLGPVDVGQLRPGRGAAGITHRHHLADEFVADLDSDRARVLSRTYRDLRTSAESVGNFSGANDLHYGERLWQKGRGAAVRGALLAHRLWPGGLRRPAVAAAGRAPRPRTPHRARARVDRRAGEDAHRRRS